MNSELFDVPDLRLKVRFCVLREQDEDEEFEVGDEKRDIQQEYKEVLDWLNDVEQRASLMAQQWSEDSQEDETKKKRKAVSLGLIIIVYVQNDSTEGTHGANSVYEDGADQLWGKCNKC